MLFTCREECIFTIDPATARDLDDALSCKQLPDGNAHNISFTVPDTWKTGFRCMFVVVVFCQTQVTSRWGSISLT